MINTHCLLGVCHLEINHFRIDLLKAFFTLCPAAQEDMLEFFTVAHKPQELLRAESQQQCDKTLHVHWHRWHRACHDLELVEVQTLQEFCIGSPDSLVLSLFCFSAEMEYGCV